VLDAIARDAGLPPPAVIEGEAFGYRHRARQKVRGRARSPKIGSFAAGTHDVVDIPRCRVHHPLINEVANAVRAGDTAIPYGSVAGSATR
jgi:tRNA/tmRNA/rRNA uracil-C5-methylase (TrmA/RlmC/RlmD family)